MKQALAGSRGRKKGPSRPGDAQSLRIARKEPRRLYMRKRRVLTRRCSTRNVMAGSRSESWSTGLLSSLEAGSFAHAPSSPRPPGCSSGSCSGAPPGTCPPAGSSARSRHPGHQRAPAPPPPCPPPTPGPRALCGGPPAPSRPLHPLPLRPSPLPSLPAFDSAASACRNACQERPQRDHTGKEGGHRST